MMKLTQTDLWTIRGIIQKSSWSEFMGHIAGIMAEQADKVQRGSEQDKNLYECSNTIYALNNFFEKCGRFDYRNNKLTPEEFKTILNQYAPV